MSGALVLSDVSIARAGRRVVSGVSLEVPAGEITALLGPNGAGKSSLVLALSGVVPLAGGDVTLDGTRISGLRPERIRAAGLATVPEGHRVLGDLTVADNLRVAAGDLGKRELASAVARMHELFGELAALSARRAASLSGGQQQMLALGQALIGRPRYLIVDELSLGLAPVVVRRLAPALDEIASGGVGVLLIEQFTSLALRLATRAHVLVRGALRLSEPAATLRERPELLEASYRLGGGPATRR